MKKRILAIILIFFAFSIGGVYLWLDSSRPVCADIKIVKSEPEELSTYSVEIYVGKLIKTGFFDSPEWIRNVLAKNLADSSAREYLFQYCIVDDHLVFRLSNLKTTKANTREISSYNRHMQVAYMLLMGEGLAQIDRSMQSTGTALSELNNSEPTEYGFSLNPQKALFQKHVPWLSTGKYAFNKVEHSDGYLAELKEEHHDQTNGSYDRTLVHIALIPKNQSIKPFFNDVLYGNSERLEKTYCEYDRIWIAFYITSSRNRAYFKEDILVSIYPRYDLLEKDGALPEQQVSLNRNYGVHLGVRGTGNIVPEEPKSWHEILQEWLKEFF